ncbi:septum formation initiator family protein [bacterium]|nr:septum formation initiator family protein [bacterium]
MQTNNKYRQKISEFIDRLSDLRFLMQIGFAIFILMISWSGIQSIQANYNLQKQITELNQQNDLMTMSNENLRLQNDYFKSNQYLELSARRNFGLAAPGEKVIVVPKSVALSAVSDIKIQDNNATSLAKKTVMQNNAKSWLDFFLNRHD